MNNKKRKVVLGKVLTPVYIHLVSTITSSPQLYQLAIVHPNKISGRQTPVDSIIFLCVHTQNVLGDHFFQSVCLSDFSQLIPKTLKNASSKSAMAFRDITLNEGYEHNLIGMYKYRQFFSRYFLLLLSGYWLHLLRIAHSVSYCWCMSSCTPAVTKWHAGQVWIYSRE